MNKKRILASALTVLSIISVGGYVYSRTNKVKNCEEVLTDFTNNHACLLTIDGAIVFELYSDAAPKSIDKFKKLSNDVKFYDDLEIYRNAKDFVLQGGIQDIQGRLKDVQISDENLKSKFKYSEEGIETEANFEKLGLTQEEIDALTAEGYKSDAALNTRNFEYGSLAFANAGPNTNSTEFFIVTSKDPLNESLKSLKGKFTNFGKIVSGSELLDKINNMEVQGDTLINKVKILELRVK